jgi:basic membrane lipoprotein Med (substrate-binding protein (PBP1-ABC) superfamily)
MRTLGVVSRSIAVAVLVAGCGATAQTSTKPQTTTVTQTGQVGLRVGVVGRLEVRAQGAVVERVSLRASSDQSLVLVATSPRVADRVAAEALAHTLTHYVLVGESAAARHLANLTGVVIRDDQAARLGGAVAALAVSGQNDRRVAWVGPMDSALADSFAQGVHALEPGTVILRAWSADRPASCKESALGAIARGATVIMGPHGLCAAAAIDGAHERNQAGLELSDFELPNVAAAQIVRDAIHGRYHGGEDILFGVTSGAVAVRHLDPLLSAVVRSRARALAEQLASGRPLSG